MKEELNDIRNGTAKNILHTLDLNCYNFGTEFPVLGKFKLTEPEGFDPDDLPNSIGIDFDLNYDASNSNQQPFEVSGPFPLFFTILRNEKILRNIIENC